MKELQDSASRFVKALHGDLKENENKYLTVSTVRRVLFSTFPNIKQFCYSSEECEEKVMYLIKSFFEVDGIVYAQDDELLLSESYQLLYKIIVLHKRLEME